MADFIVAGILILIVCAAGFYIIKEKRKGVKCIGCSAGGCCSGKNCGSTEGKCGCCSGKNS